MAVAVDGGRVGVGDRVVGAAVGVCVGVAGVGVGVTLGVAVAAGTAAVAVGGTGVLVDVAGVAVAVAVTSAPRVAVAVGVAVETASGALAVGEAVGVASVTNAPATDALAVAVGSCLVGDEAAAARSVPSRWRKRCTVALLSTAPLDGSSSAGCWPLPVGATVSGCAMTSPSRPGSAIVTDSISRASFVAAAVLRPPGSAFGAGTASSRAEATCADVVSLASGCTPLTNFGGAISKLDIVESASDNAATDMMMTNGSGRTCVRCNERASHVVIRLEFRAHPHTPAHVT